MAKQRTMNSSALSTTSVPTIHSTTLLPTLKPLPEYEVNQEGSRAIGYVLISAAVITVVVVASVLVLMLLRKSRMNRLRHHLMPLYNFDGTDDDQEEWEAELLDDISDSHRLRRGYKSMEFPTPHRMSTFS